MQILLLTPHNAGLLQNVGPDVFDHPVDASHLAAFLSDPRHIMYLAVDTGVVVGMASAVEYFHPDKPPQLWINEVGVASTHRRRGAGRALVAALVQAGRERGCVFAWLGTDADNHPAQHCFGSVAGVETAQPFLLYEWDLDDPDERSEAC